MSFLRAHVAKGTILNADEAGSWDELHKRYEVKRINHEEAYSMDGACTNWAEEFFSRMRRAEISHHHQSRTCVMAETEEGTRTVAEIGRRARRQLGVDGCTAAGGATPSPTRSSSAEGGWSGANAPPSSSRMRSANYCFPKTWPTDREQRARYIGE
jgi:ISXO2-like transposase domain